MTALAELPPVTSPGASRVELGVEYWTVARDGQDSCGSCDQTLAVVDDAVDTLRPIAERLGVNIQVRPHTITTWAEALDHAIVASPTIRSAGIELRPAHVDGSESRRWHWRGQVSPTVSSQAVLSVLVRALGKRSEDVENYLAGNGPAPYVRQFLQSDPESAQPVATGATTQSEADQPAAAACGCGTSCT
jgi:hypothetical protein